eukprot:5658973-Pleurochrysis_carterae.AAC.1
MSPPAARIEKLSKAAALMRAETGYLGPGSRFFASGKNDCTQECDSAKRNKVLMDLQMARGT